MLKGLERRKIPCMNEEVTFIGFGALEIGRDWGLGSGKETRRPDDEEAKYVLENVLDIGINLVDTASAYHRSEERIGKYISHRRKDYLLASKCGEHNDEPRTFYDFSYKAIKESIDRSLKLLKTDVIDIMQIHFGPEAKEVIDRGETVGAMKDARREGKIRFLGASIDGELATRCINSGDFEIMQMAYSLLDRTNEENIKLASKNGIGVFIRSGLAAGKLTARVIPHLDEDFAGKEAVKKMLALVNNDGDMLATLALEFLYRNKGISSVLVGSKKIEHIRSNFNLLEQPVAEEILAKALTK